MVILWKSSLYIGMHVRACGEEDRSEDVRLEGGVHMCDQSRCEKETEDACPM